MTVRRAKGYADMTVRQLKNAQKKSKTDLEYQAIEQFIAVKQGTAMPDRSLAAARKAGKAPTDDFGPPAARPAPVETQPKLSAGEAAKQLAVLQQRMNGAKTDMEYWSYASEIEKLKKSQG